MPEKKIPAELKHGALRVCHSMVANRYRLKNRIRDIGGFIARTSSGAPKSLPIEPDWVIDWADFFEHHAGKPPTIPSNGLGPWFSLSLADSRPFDDGSGRTLADAVRSLSLTLNDYDRARQTGMLGTDVLQAFKAVATIDGIKPPLLDDAGMLAHIREWLLNPRNKGGLGIAPLSAADVATVLPVLPLPFFLAFEAMVEGEGSRFGRIGSAIIATTLSPLLEKDQPINDAQVLPCVSSMAALVAILVPRPEEALVAAASPFGLTG